MSTSRGVDDMNLIRDLPTTLRSDLCMALTESTIGRNSLFADLDQLFISSLVRRLLQRILLVGEYLFHEGITYAQTIRTCHHVHQHICYWTT